MGLVIKERGVSLNSLGGEHLRSNPAILSPINRTLLAWSRTSLSRNLPLVIICGYSDATATKYCLTLDEILLTTGKDCTVGDQQVLGNARIRNYDKELVAHPEREEWSISR